MDLMFKKDELIKRGFVEVKDGGESYLQFLNDRDDYFTSKFLTAEAVDGTDDYEVKLSGKTAMGRAAVDKYIANSGGKELFTGAELSAKGFELVPHKTGYKLQFHFEPNSETSKFLTTGVHSLSDMAKPAIKVLNTVQDNEYKYLTDTQIDKLIKRGGY